MSDLRNDHPRCDCGPLDVIVTNQPEKFDRTRAHRSCWVCGKPECVLDAMAWVQRGTGEKPWWRVGTSGPFSDALYVAEVQS